MKRIALLAALVLIAGVLQAQTMTRVRPVALPTPVAADPSAVSLPKDYQALYQKEAEKNRQLKAEVATLTSRIAEITRPGGSLVQAYCETPTLSRNTAGAQNDCATSGFACEPVSGLCRTSARSSAECAAGFTYCVIRGNCVRSADECQ